MSILDLFNKESEPILPSKTSDPLTLHKQSHQIILEEGDKAIKKIASQREDWCKEVSTSLKKELDKYEKYYNRQPLESNPDYLDLSLFARIEDLFARVIQEFNNKKKTKEQYYMEQFILEIKELNSLLNSDFAPEFHDDEYFQGYAVYLFAKCEEAQLFKEEKDGAKVLDFLEAEYQKKPTDELELKIKEVKHSHNDVLYKLSDYSAIEKSINWQLEDMKKTIRKAERKRLEKGTV